MPVDRPCIWWAGYRNLVMNWLRSQKTDNIARALRNNAWNPRPLFAQLGKLNL